ncbi:MAG: hypothetical protein ABIT37_23810 [Luteolibacter sp.]
MKITRALDIRHLGITTGRDQQGLGGQSPPVRTDHGEPIAGSLHIAYLSCNVRDGIELRDLFPTGPEEFGWITAIMPEKAAG